MAEAEKKERKLTPKQLEKIDNAVALFTKTMQYRIIMNTHSIIANSPLPKKKAIKHQQLLAEWVSKVQNKQAELDELLKKLSTRQLEQYSVRCQELQP